MTNGRATKTRPKSRCLGVGSSILQRAPVPSVCIIVFALLLHGCTGFYTAHPVADAQTSQIDGRLLGSWKRRVEGNRPSWIVRFSSEDKAAGTLALLRYDARQSDYVQTNESTVYCIRLGDDGLCSASLDDQPVPAVKEDMQGGVTFSFGSMKALGAEPKHVVAHYAIRENGDVAVYAHLLADKLKQQIAQENIASIAAPFVVTEPTQGLARLLSGDARTLFKNNPTVMQPIREESLEEKVLRLRKELGSPSPHQAYNAALELGKLGPKAGEAVSDLTEILWRWLESEAAVPEAVVKGAVLALGQIGASTPDTLAALRASLETATVTGERELVQKITLTLDILETK